VNQAVAQRYRGMTVLFIALYIRGADRSTFSYGLIHSHSQKRMGFRTQANDGPSAKPSDVSGIWAIADYLSAQDTPASAASLGHIPA
jgi:hypothetical protein